MNLAEIQSFRLIGRRLRHEREARGLTLPTLADSCGLAISELVRIENGELLGFKQALDSSLNNAEVYAKALGVEFDHAGRRHSEVRTINDEVFIPVFLRKK